MRIFERISTVNGVGYFPYFPGTVGSFIGLAICMFLHGNFPVYILAFLMLFFTGLKSADMTEKAKNIKDPSFVIIDELACIFPVFLFVPITIFNVVIGFLLYRSLDILKPPPIRKVEKLGGGWGIMLDDLIAGIFSNILLRLIMILK